MNSIFHFSHSFLSTTNDDKHGEIQVIGDVNDVNYNKPNQNNSKLWIYWFSNCCMDFVESCLFDCLLQFRNVVSMIKVFEIVVSIERCVLMWFKNCYVSSEHFQIYSRSPALAHLSCSFLWSESSIDKHE